ncbi:MAG: XRE family transcriptional regulator [Gammaproteobacteria bacterium]|nr:XRE family transcriptional regulator [Gammaproteobacteria bacterium]
MAKTSRNKHIGSDFDAFLREEALLAQAQAMAIKRVLATQVTTAMREQGITKAELAKRLRTSRAQLDRLLDPDNASVTLQTIGRVAQLLGKRIVFGLENAGKKRRAA